MLFAEGEERRRSRWAFRDGGLQALDALLRSGGGGAADVVLEGAELDAAGGGEEGLLGDGEVGIDLAGDLPGEGVFDVEEAGELGWSLRAAAERRSSLTLEDLGLDWMRGPSVVKLPTMTKSASRVWAMRMVVARVG